MVRRVIQSLLAAWCAAAALAVAAADGIEVNVRADLGRESVVEAECVIPVPRATVWRVLTDYDHLDTMVPFLTHSRVVREEAGAKLLHQTGRGRLWIFHRRFTVTFRVEEVPEASISFTAVEGDFRRFDGIWRLETEAQGTRVRHRVAIEPKFYLPRWAVRVVAKHLMRKSLEGVISRCLREAARSAARGTSFATPMAARSAAR